MLVLGCAPGLAGRTGRCFGPSECGTFALLLAEALRLGPLSAVLLALGSPESRAVEGGRLEVNEVHPVRVRVARADAEDRGAVEFLRAVLGGEGVHHPMGAAKQEAAAVGVSASICLGMRHRMSWPLGWM